MSSHGVSRSQKERSSPESDSTKSGSIPPETKRRASRAGTRSVSQLSQVQLERKRANDREAQRAIRQRTKDRIEALEKRIKELEEGGTNEQQLISALKVNKELVEENAQLRRCIEQAGIPIPVQSGDRASSWDDLNIRQPPQLQVQAGMQITGPQLGSSSLISSRESQTGHPSYGYRSISQWQSSSPFEGPNQPKSESSPSPGSQISPHQYMPWTAQSSGGRTRIPSHGEGPGMPSQQLDYPGLASSQTHQGQPLPYHHVPSSVGQSQPAMPLQMSPPGIAQYGPIHQPYIQQQHGQPGQQSQQSPSTHVSSRTSSPQSPPGSHAMYYANYPHQQ